MKVSSVTPLVLGQVASAALYDTVINTKYGAVKGAKAFTSEPAGNISAWETITAWKGIPFAESTAGGNRFRPPQPKTPWNGTLDASNFTDVCPSATSGDDYTISEDCLSLNIWSGANDTSTKRPVMLWSYPAESTAADSLFDGGGMASQGIVFVNYNYRTGPLGWMANPELGEEMIKEVGRNVSGNWGMLDQFAALQWVHANIADFGGDPDQITIAGQSAGSAATYHMLNSPLTKGLIAGAIIESGVRWPHDPELTTLAEGYVNMSSAIESGEDLMADLNVTTIAELRELSVDTIVDAAGRTSFGAVLDYWALPDTYINTLTNGPANNVPVITGNTKDESGANLPISITVSEYKSDLVEQYGEEFAERFLKLYPAANDTQAGMSYNAHYRDTSLTGTWLWANLWDQSPTTHPVYSYYWDHAPPGQDRGSYHESEICYVLGNLYGTDLPFVAEDYAISRKMNGYWANFVKTHNPNTGGSYAGNLTYWAPSTPTKNLTMELGDGWGPHVVAQQESIELIEEFWATQQAY